MAFQSPHSIALASLLSLLSLAGVGGGLVAPAQAQMRSGNTALLETRRSQLRQFIEQQQVSLKNQLECTSSARSLEELDRCQRGYPRMGPGMHGSWGTGGWGCPPW